MEKSPSEAADFNDVPIFYSYSDNDNKIKRKTRTMQKILLQLLDLDTYIRPLISQKLKQKA